MVVLTFIRGVMQSITIHVADTDIDFLSFHNYSSNTNILFSYILQNAK